MVCAEICTSGSSDRGSIRTTEINTQADSFALIGKPVTHIASLPAAMNAGQVYVNVSMQLYPDCAMRGQLPQ
jgi:hypothetical protein